MVRSFYCSEWWSKSQCTSLSLGPAVLFLLQAYTVQGTDRLLACLWAKLGNSLLQLSSVQDSSSLSGLFRLLSMFPLPRNMSVSLGDLAVHPVSRLWLPLGKPANNSSSNSSHHSKLIPISHSTRALCLSLPYVLLFSTICLFSLTL